MRTLRQQIESKCIHFNGTQNKACKLGISYDSFISRREIPCIKFDDVLCPDTCDRREWPTEEAVLKRLAEIEAAHVRFEKVAPLVMRVRKKHSGKDWVGTEKCLVCGGELHLSHAAYNGHVHGKCATPGCLAWME